MAEEVVQGRRELPMHGGRSRPERGRTLHRLGMAMPGNEPTVFSGVYQVVRPNEALVYTWEGGEGEHITLVTAIFSDRGNGSRVDFTHGVFLNPESRDLHSQGWMACFESLRRVLGE